MNLDFVYIAHVRVCDMIVFAKYIVSTTRISAGTHAQSKATYMPRTLSYHIKCVAVMHYYLATKAVLKNKNVDRLN